MELDIFSDIACPWCWIGKTRLQKALATFEAPVPIRVRYRAFELQPDLPPEGLPAEAFFAAKFGSPQRIAEIFGHVTAVGAGDGLAFRFDRMTRAANTRLAHRLIQTVQREGRDAGPLVEALFAAHFTQGADVSAHDTLVETARTAGLEDAVELVAAVRAGAGDDLVEADRALAGRWGVRGVPFFVADARVAVSGAQATSVFEEFLREAFVENAE